MLPIRWEPHREFIRLERLMDHIVRRPIEPFWTWPSQWDGRIRPALDVYETPERLVVKATIPGIEANDLEVTINQDTLVIKAESTEKHEEKEERYLLRERRAGAFHRALYLPEGLDTAKGEATFDNGVLTVSFPKSEKAEAREIKVKVKETSTSKKV